MRRPNRITQRDGTVVRVLSSALYQTNAYARLMQSVSGVPTDAERKYVRKARTQGVKWDAAADVLVAARRAQQATEIAAMADGELQGHLDAATVCFSRDTESMRSYRAALMREQDRRSVEGR